jgi:hypothetical protein
MTTPSRRMMVLVAFLVVATVTFLTIGPLSGPTRTPGAATGGATGSGGRGRAQDTGVPDVRLDLLQREEGAFQNPVRNPFRFERRTTPGAPTGPPRGRGPRVAEAPPQPVGPPPVPPPPPIPLRYIGFLQPQGGPGRIAVLSDGRGTVIDGKEGDVIDGRYRLLRIGNDSADLIYLDGRGRQTIRLSGQ